MIQLTIPVFVQLCLYIGAEIEIRKIFSLIVSMAAPASGQRMLPKIPIAAMTKTTLFFLIFHFSSFASS